jgi:hypothetical protein
MELTKGQKVYYTRIFESVGVFEVIDLKIRTVEDTWFVGTEERTKQAYMLGIGSINKTVFFTRQQALDIVLEAQAHSKKKVSNEKYYEEY